MDPSKPHAWFADLSRTYGGLIYLKFCRLPLVVICSAEAAKKALRNNDLAFAGRPSNSASVRLSYGNSDMIASRYSKYWRRTRKMVVNHLFSAAKVRLFRPVCEEEVSRMIGEVSEKASDGRLVDVGETLSSFSCNVLCRLAFRKKFEQGTESWRRFEKIVKQFSASLMEGFFYDCVVFAWVLSRLSGAAGRVETVFKDMDSFYQEVIDKHLSANRPESMTNNGFLDLLIQLREDDSAPVMIDWNHVKAILMNLFMAGIESSGGTLLWALTALMKNPSTMKKLQEEIRTLHFPCIIDGYVIQPKTLVFANIWAIGRDPQYWENPYEFLPERFLNTDIDIRGQDFGFIPFGSGRRMCPGLPLAIPTMEVALANLVYFFNWEIPRGYDVDDDTSLGIGLHKKNSLWLKAISFTSQFGTTL